MRETPDDLVALEALLDRSMAAAGTHLARVITPERRLGAVDVCRRLDGIRLLTLATTTAVGRPLAAPVDGIFYRGAFHFGTAPDALRLGHLRARPDVSVTHLPGEEFAVTVHGRAEIIDIGAPAHAELRDVVLGIYAPRYGPEWERFLAASVYVRIDAQRMFVFAMSAY